MNTASVLLVVSLFIGAVNLFRMSLKDTALDFRPYCAATLKGTLYTNISYVEYLT